MRIIFGTIFHLYIYLWIRQNDTITIFIYVIVLWTRRQILELLHPLDVEISDLHLASWAFSLVDDEDSCLFAVDGKTFFLVFIYSAV